MAVTSQDIANQAIQLIGDDQPPVTGQYPNFDSSPAGVALNKLYGPCIQTVLRQQPWDCARNTQALALSGNTAPFPWTFEYLYPAGGVEVWQVMPETIADPNNPLPVNFTIGNDIIGGVQQRVIFANLANAQCVFSNTPTEATWDALFREAVVRLLASELAMAIAGRPDTAQGTFGSYEEFSGVGGMRGD